VLAATDDLELNAPEVAATTFDSESFVTADAAGNTLPAGEDGMVYMGVDEGMRTYATPGEARAMDRRAGAVWDGSYGIDGRYTHLGTEFTERDVMAKNNNVSFPSLWKEYISPVNDSSEFTAISALAEVAQHVDGIEYNNVRAAVAPNPKGKGVHILADAVNPATTPFSMDVRLVSDSVKYEGAIVTNVPTYDNVINLRGFSNVVEKIPVAGNIMTYGGILADTAQGEYGKAIYGSANELVMTAASALLVFGPVGVVGFAGIVALDMVFGDDVEDYVAPKVDGLLEEYWF
jgi:hypothetical protein